MDRRIIIGIIVTLFLVSGVTFGQQSSQRENHLWRYVGLAGGAFGGLVLGWSLVDDDALYAERKLATSLTLCTAAGALGGYFLGRAIDKSTTSYVYKVDPVQMQQALRSWAKDEVVRLNLSNGGNHSTAAEQVEAAPADRPHS